MTASSPACAAIFVKIIDLRIKIKRWALVGYWSWVEKKTRLKLWFQ
jgi:hypothetical protein